MAYRKSSYIDFERGTVLVQPMELYRRYSPPWSLEEMRALFECRVDVWQLGAAVEVLKSIEAQQPGGPSVWAHAAYALLAILFPYFEMIGKTLNPNSEPRNTARLDFNYGFCDVYPVFSVPDKEPTDKNVPAVVQFRDRVRNGIYHLGYTKSNVFLHNEPSRRIPADFCVERAPGGPVYLVNPHRLARTVVAHFPTFMGRLRDRNPEFDGLRRRFRRFFTEFHGPS